MSLIGGLSRLALAAFSVSALPGNAQAPGKPVLESVFIEIQADGKTCVMRGQSVECNKALGYLRVVLKHPPGAVVRFKADRAAPYQAVKAVMDAVRKSEYTTSVAYLSAPRSEQKP